VLDSDHAQLVVADANRVLVGIINRQVRDVPLDDVDVRRALNLAVDRARIVAEGLAGYASPLSALTPSWCSGFPAGAHPYAHDPKRAQDLFRGWPAGRPVRIASPEPFAGIARLVAEDVEASLGVTAEVIIVPETAMPAGGRVLIEKKLTAPWDLLLFGWFDLSSEAPPAAVHREFFGRDGAFRMGPPNPEFDALFDEMKVQLDGQGLVKGAERIDAHCFDQALALFLCAPQALYAVNNHVSFGPYRTTFEVAEVTVDDQHWSRTGGGADLSAPGDGSAITSGAPAAGVAGYGGGIETVDTAAGTDKPGFSGASGNAC